MMVKFRDLLNPLILNDGWVGFCGDSEYISENGEVRMGYWAFLDALEIDDGHSGNYLTLDDEIDDSKLFGETRWEVENDEGLLCTVKFMYNCANEMTYINSLHSICIYLVIAISSFPIFITSF